MAVFTRMTGQDFNLGDTVLRRAMLERVATSAPFHVLVKNHSPDYVDALGLRSGDVVYPTKAVFSDALRDHAARGPVVLLEKPGAIRPAGRVDRDVLRRLRRVARVRRSGGAILSLGAGVVDPPSRLGRATMRALTIADDMLCWRDPGSAAWYGFGQVMPDWAFALPASGRAAGPRRKLGLSLRGDRDGPPEEWLSAVARYAAEAGLEPVAVSQVRIDDGHVHAVADRLRCEAVTWDAAATHRDQEALVRDVYAECAMVLSDRLHVLILAATEGAAPACLMPFAEHKIGRHFDAIGLPGVAADVGGMGQAEAVAAFAKAAARRDEARRCVDDARVRVDAIGREARGRIEARLGLGGDAAA